MVTAAPAEALKPGLQAAGIQTTLTG